MVHDSGSFVIDYLYFHHPVMYISQDIERAKSYVNVPGQQAYGAHYIGSTLDDIERFVNDVVLGGKDTMQEKRQDYFNEFLQPPDGQSTASNIYHDMLRSLGME